MTVRNWQFALGAGLMALAAGGVASAQTENTLLTFTGANGSVPWTGLIEDGNGHFYGATENGGASSNGMVYRLSRNARGQWKEKILYSFTGGGGNGDGAFPQMPFLVMDSHGALYGTTPNGGAYNYGTVFKLTRGKPQWKEEILYSFMGENDGGTPIGGVTLDSKGNVYGTTNVGGGNQYCGGSGCGVIFELARGRNGTWTESVPHAFEGIPQNYKCNVAYDGENPYRTTLALDSAGNLYGTTSAGGEGCGSFGTVWELSPSHGGSWSYSIIHTMGSVPGDTYPDAGGVLDSQDNFYFATGAGNIFELVAAQGWGEQELYQYPAGSEDDYDTVSFDNAGNLYYTGAGGGGAGYTGAVEKLTPDGKGGWTHSTLYAFANNGPAGNSPTAGVMIDASGNVYGTCSTGGASYGDQGTVFEITQ